MIDTINKEIENSLSTIFDSYPIRIDARAGGMSLKEQLMELVSLFGTINKLSTNALFLYEQSRSRYDKVESLAWETVESGKRIAVQQKITLREVKIKIDGEETCLNDEQARVALYEFVSNRGKDKVKEIAAAIDIGRSLLSWEKMAVERNM